MLIGCDDKKSAPASGSAAAPQAAATGTATGAASGATKPAALTDAQLDSEDLPVAEDFEEEADKSITDENIDEQVEKLAKEIDEK
jgi:hypothetical protein